MAQSNQKQKSLTSDNSASGSGIATVASSAERVGSTKGEGPVTPALQTADKPVDIFGGFVFWTLVVLVGF
jgi:hypothetical protein